ASRASARSRAVPPGPGSGRRPAGPPSTGSPDPRAARLRSRTRGTGGGPPGATELSRSPATWLGRWAAGTVPPMLAPDVEDLISRALAEDGGPRDLTTEAVVDAGQPARALIVQKAPGVVFGLDVAEAVFRRLDPLV